MANLFSQDDSTDLSGDDDYDGNYQLVQPDRNKADSRIETKCCSNRRHNGLSHTEPARRHTDQLSQDKGTGKQQGLTHRYILREHWD